MSGLVNLKISNQSQRKIIEYDIPQRTCTLKYNYIHTQWNEIIITVQITQHCIHGTRYMEQPTVYAFIKTLSTVISLICLTHTLYVYM